MPLAAILFDVDGVLVDSPHERAWRETLDELMRGAWREIRLRNSYAPEKFTPALYQRRSRSADYDGRLLRRRPCARVEERR